MPLKVPGEEGLLGREQIQSLWMISRTGGVDEEKTSYV